MKKYNFILILFVLATFVISCSDDENNDINNSEGTAQVAVKLTDAPGDYEEVWVEVEAVKVKMGTGVAPEVESEESEEGWISLAEVESQRINLLDLTGGVTQLLTETEIPSGHLKEMRLVLGDNNTIVVEGQELVLATPSAGQSGLKLQVDEDLLADTYYTFILDFDVEQSVVNQGNGSFSLKPVIRFSIDENAGSIAGTVTPSIDPVLVEAQSASGTVSAYTNTEGKFQLHGLEPGTYIVTVIPEEGAGLEQSMVNNVEVEKGVVTELEPIILEETSNTAE